MNERIKRLRELMFRNSHESVFYERAILLERAKKLYAELGEGRGILYARAFAYLLDNITVEIRPDEKLVGFAKMTEPDPEQEKIFSELARDNNFKITPHVTFDPLGLIDVNDADGRYCPDWFCSYGHNAPYYPDVLKYGFEGIAERAKRRLEDP